MPALTTTTSVVPGARIVVQTDMLTVILCPVHVTYIPSIGYRLIRGSDAADTVVRGEEQRQLLNTRIPWLVSKSGNVQTLLCTGGAE